MKQYLYPISHANASELALLFIKPILWYFVFVANPPLTNTMDIRPIFPRMEDTDGQIDLSIKVKLMPSLSLIRHQIM
jgi:hypothetical protein